MNTETVIYIQHSQPKNHPLLDTIKCCRLAGLYLETVLFLFFSAKEGNGAKKGKEGNRPKK